MTLEYDGPIDREARHRFVGETLRHLRPGDLIFFYHRTSWRSRIIRWVAGGPYPHACVFAGRDRVVGMLRGLVRYHRLARFYRPGYAIEVRRARPEVLAAVEPFLGQHEHLPDLAAIGWRILVARTTGWDPRDRWPPPMKGVTCSGIVSEALHRAYARPAPHPPLSDTPADLYRAAVALELPVLARLRFRRAGTLRSLGYRLRFWWYFVPYLLPLLLVLGQGPTARPDPMAWAVFGAGLALSLAGSAWRLWGAGYVAPVAQSWSPASMPLVTSGPYRWVRHPLYLGNLLGMTGLALSAAPFLPAALGAGLVASVAIGAWGLARWILAYEEPFLRRTHGRRFERWARQTPALVPRRPRRAARGPLADAFSWRAALRNEAHVLAFRLVLYAGLVWLVTRGG